MPNSAQEDSDTSSPEDNHDEDHAVDHQTIDLPSAEPSCGEMQKGDDDTKKDAKKKLRLAEATASPISVVGYQNDGGNDDETLKKGTKTAKLQLAKGAVAVSSAGAPTNKKDAVNKVRLAAGHHPEEQEEQTEETEPDDMNHDENQLVQAEQVEDVEALLDERIQNMPVAVASQDNRHDEKQQAITRRIVLFLLAVAVVGSIAAGVILSTNLDDGSTLNDENNGPTSVPSLVPTLSPTVPPEPTSAPTSFQPWIRGILEPFVEDTTPWDDPTSTQFEALQWMERDRELWLPGILTSDGVEEQLLERYAVLAISLHFAGAFERAAFSLLTVKHACDWSIDFYGVLMGFGCNGNEPRITNFEWNDQSADNTIPTEAGLLSHLQVIEVNNNRVSGTIPSFLLRMPSLRSVHLANNLLSGTLSDAIPTSLLEVLDLRGNSLSGSIPSSYGEMTNLRSLNLQNNAAISGVLPASFANLQELTDLRLSGTSLEGGMEVICGGNAPSKLSKLENLVADCGGSQPKVECTCCTSCCGNGRQDDHC